MLYAWTGMWVLSVFTSLTRNRIRMSAYSFKNNFPVDHLKKNPFYIYTPHLKNKTAASCSSVVTQSVYLRWKVFNVRFLSVVCVALILHQPLASERFRGAWNSLCSLINYECSFPSTSPRPLLCTYPLWPSSISHLVLSQLSSATISSSARNRIVFTTSYFFRVFF